MKNFGRFIANKRIAVLIVAVILIIPSLYGIAKTKINYDLLTYIPQNMDSMKGENILDKTFSSAAISMLIVENMEPKDVLVIKNKIAKVNSVEQVIWTSDLLDTSIPRDIIPDEFKNFFYHKNSTLLLIKFKDSASSETTLNAVSDIRKITNKQCFLGGMSAIVKDTKDVSDRETPLYVLVAVILSIILLSLTMESVFIPFIFLIGIGIAILYNMGTNIFLGQISYVTKALAAVLQLGVTMDFSIFLLHRYIEEKEKNENNKEAMAQAISKTFATISGCALTAIAGFLALCVMKLGLGRDIGIVMAKGVFLGVVSTCTILPSLILVFDKYIFKYQHRTLLPSFTKTANIITTKPILFLLIFIIAFVPAIYGQNRTKVYYTLDESLPKTLPSIISTNKLKADYNMTTTHMIVISDKVPSYKVREMVNKIENVGGIESVLAYDKYLGPSIPISFVPEGIKNNFEKGGYKLIVANSKYKAARNEENAQIDEIISIVKEYDKNGYVSGEGPLTKDLIEIAAVDFKNVDFVSIIAIFVIIMLLFNSISIPIVLVGSIELAIFINMAIPYYTGTTIPFVASIVIGCIQLGSTINYAILITSRYREELRNGVDKSEAMRCAVKGSARSIVTSALAFFGSTSAVAIVSDISMIKQLCVMLSRGALISMIIIVFILPSILVLFEGIINITSLHWRTKPKFLKNHSNMESI